MRSREPDVSRLIQKALDHGSVTIERADPERFGPGFSVEIVDGYEGRGVSRYLKTALQRALAHGAAMRGQNSEW